MEASNTGNGCNTNYTSYEMDGGTYKIHTCVRDQKPSIDGTKTFTQYFSVRQNMVGARRSCGTYSITEHFKKWAEQGLQLGNLYEAKFLAEAGGGTGTFDATYIKFSQEDAPRGQIPEGHFSLVTYVSPSSGGTVAKSPSATSYAPGSTVQLTATPSSGWAFTGWSGDQTGSTNPVEITMNKSKVITATFGPTSDGTENLVKSGNFPSNSVSADDGYDWKLGQGEHWGNSQASVSVSNGSVTVNISTTGEELYQPQLVQYGIDLVQGMKYRLTFEAKADAAKSIDVGLQQSSSPWATYYEETFQLTTTSKEYAMEFTMDSTSDAGSQLAFNLGSSTTNVTISNVKLVYLASAIPEPSSSSGEDGSSSSGDDASSSSDGGASSSATTSGGSSSSAAQSSSSSGSVSPIRVISSLSMVDFRVRSLSGALQIESKANAAIYLYDINGSKVLSFNVPAGESIVKLSLPPGIYIAKNAGIKKAQKVMIK
jgi:uncharacterized repeat protein (TIGR02543 family)